jgi:hypothetical protein
VRVIYHLGSVLRPTFDDITQVLFLWPEEEVLASKGVVEYNVGI